ncbi:hypothetical protein Cni_G00153 [Canna indica]|uniref:Malectin-like domain-containing protein n=1 Tax=Canna indica TaxID=4628 RepID=A0AAQ3PZV9_9LILI|nr:hypothetical protein Cni_G00153 [Canna indica]
MNLSQYLVLFLRLNLGTTTDQVIRYPDDRYDRLWDPFSFWSDRLNFQPALTSITTNQTVVIDPGSNGAFEGFLQQQESSAELSNHYKSRHVNNAT